MKPRPRAFPVSTRLFVTAGTALAAALAGCDQQAEARAPATTKSATTSAAADRRLEPYRDELLDLAFAAATALPVDPHIKTRSRAQEAVVAACLELEQPQRALRYNDRIDNWRRGAAYADLAFYWAQCGDTVAAQRYLDLAMQIENQSRDDANAQEWRVDRIRAKVAKTYLLLGETQRAAELSTNLSVSEVGEVEATTAALTAPGAFEERIKALDATLALGEFDRTRGALAGCSRLFDRFYADPARRARVEQLIDTASAKLPTLAHVELRAELAELALAHGDQAKALEMTAVAARAMERARLPDQHVSLIARLAALRFRAGDQEAARRDVAAALDTFKAERQKIVDIYRAGALRAIAEAYDSIGDAVSALAVYKMAIAAGVENPNSRPRAEDLSATCTSMAVHAVEPDADLRARIAGIRAGLGHPW